MGINISQKTDYSTLFSSLNTNNKSGTGDISSLITDYNTIKSGTYGKLMKAYYAGDTSKEVSSIASSKNSNQVTTSETEKLYNTVSTSADALAASGDKLSKLDKESTDEEKYNALNSFVGNYNSLLTAASKVDSSSVNGRIDNIKTTTATYSKELNKLGISVESDGLLKLNKDTFDAADKSSMSTLFAARSSYGYSVSTSAQMAQSNANYEATKASLYNSDGTVSNSAGTLFETLS